MPISHLTNWAEDNPSGRPVHVVRHRRGALSCDRHDHKHDFAEVFWCESGGCRHLVNGECQVIAPGDAVFIRPSDRHSFSTGPAGLTIVNVSFRPADAVHLARRHRADWPWRPGPLPLRVRLGSRAMQRLHAWVEDLALAGRTAIELEGFLLDLLRLVAHGRDTGPAAGLPAWLAGAVEAFSSPEHLPGGTHSLARLAGRHPDHVNRVLQACQGRTATALVESLRLDWAASRLRLDDGTVAGIAAACGLRNLGHFHQRFRSRFGTTPHRYRRAARLNPAR